MFSTKLLCARIRRVRRSLPPSPMKTFSFVRTRPTRSASHRLSSAAPAAIVRLIGKMIICSPSCTGWSGDRDGVALRGEQGKPAPENDVAAIPAQWACLCGQKRYSRARSGTRHHLALRHLPAEDFSCVIQAGMGFGAAGGPVFSGNGNDKSG
ncbi:protein of unknown function [uncultured Sphingopyxis sp.]|uniref:Uncharacterized protein n=1 Tax=uncultured Sphingopyxis sp. TaxID=310581 RepID=A0A1Y5Q1U2_9SPHN|nr:protein of unknown function [uncultured Sphingopyxis sp.]